MEEQSTLFICLCKKSFEEKQKYIEHARDCEIYKGISENQQKIDCPICRKTISSRKYFIKTHLNFHEGMARSS